MSEGSGDGEDRMKLRRFVRLLGSSTSGNSNRVLRMNPDNEMMAHANEDTLVDIYCAYSQRRIDEFTTN